MPFDIVSARRALEMVNMVKEQAEQNDWFG